MFEMVKLAYDELKLQDNKRLLLVSFMGCGEPVLNHDAVVRSMYYVRDMHADSRFAVATMIPKELWGSYFDMLRQMYRLGLRVKIHLSLHFPWDKIRGEWMPHALEVKPALAALEFWKALVSA
jgi:adenine C2-methylase RlmN of 23S rRNA A2503 and tRNA A37